MESLPEDVLVHIFSFLRPRYLLGPVRAVCWAWRTLALHRDAWKHASLSCLTSFDKKLLERVLRLAPCLDTLKVARVSTSPEILQAMATSSCQVKSLFILRLEFCTVLDFLRLQVPHIRCLVLALTHLDDLADIIAVIQNMALEELCVRCRTEMTPSLEGLLFERPLRNRNLKALSFCFNSDFDPLIESLVTTNAASLQEICAFDDLDPMPLTLKAVRALSCKLKLSVPASWLQEINGVNVSHLTVNMHARFRWPERWEAEMEGLSALSTGFIRPSSLSFCVNTNDSTLAAESVLTCLKEMCTLGRCEHVEVLSVQLPTDDAETVTDWMTSLCKLPNLRELHLQDKLPLSSLWAFAGMKSLKLLNLEKCGCFCRPDFCGVLALLRLIARMPGLHVIGLHLTHCCEKTLSLPVGEMGKSYGLRGHCQAKCALCACWLAVRGCWATQPEGTLFPEHSLFWVCLEEKMRKS